jgi:hypothetical protein
MYGFKIVDFLPIISIKRVLSASVRSPKKNLTYRDQLRIGLVMGSGPEAQNYIT